MSARIFSALEMRRVPCAELCGLAFYWFLASLVASSNAQAAGAPGEQLYRQKCAACHGPNGEGVKEQYGKPLAGDRTVEELAQIIAKTMPEDNPGSCVGDDAKNVASFIYHAFYSPVAQERNRPARIELSRLTVRQYRHTIADLVGSFRGETKWGDERGLQGEYFKSNRYRKEEREIDRLDGEVKFDFGENSPAENLPAEEFAIRWQGSLLAPESGEYEFILNVQNGVRLWVNDLNKPLIDGWVKSGTNIELREPIKLLGGRVYPVKLEFFKSKKGKEKTAAVALRWKAPHRVDEVIPARNLSPLRSPTVLVIEPPFPPDDRSMGYERGTSISKAWEQATTDAAIEVAGYVSSHLSELSGVKNDSKDRAAKLQEFAGRFVERAFRRPLSAAEKTIFVERQFQQATDLDVAIQRIVILTLMSPRFLYLEADGAKLDQYDVACRLSYSLWDSLPDQPLLQAAAAGQLNTPDQIRNQAQRMAGDLRTRAKMREFFVQWLQIDRFVDLAKDSKRYPEFTKEIVADLRTALELFVEDTVWSEPSDFRQLLLADTLFLNGRLGKFYGANIPENSHFTQVALAHKEQLAGILTHPYLMAGFAYTSTSSPIHRGVFVARSVLGRALRPPPEAVAPLAADLHADLTTRDRVSLQTKAESCMACHRMINPLGFAFENFDAVGRFRADEQGKPINAQGTYQTKTGELTKFNNVRELATFLAGSEESHAAFVEQLFHYLVKQPIRAFGSQESKKLRQSFIKNDYSMKQLAVEIAVSAAAQASEMKAVSAR